MKTEHPLRFVQNAQNQIKTIRRIKLNDPDIYFSYNSANLH